MDKSVTEYFLPRRGQHMDQERKYQNDPERLHRFPDHDRRHARNHDASQREYRHKQVRPWIVRQENGTNKNHGAENFRPRIHTVEE